MIGIYRERLPIAQGRLRGLPLIFEGIAQVVMGIRIMRVYLQRLSITRQRFGKLP